MPNARAPADTGRAPAGPARRRTVIADTGRAPAGPARRRTVIAATTLACVGLAAVTGCSADSPQPSTP